MSRRLRIENSKSASSFIYAEPECQEFEIPAGGCVDLELLGGNDPVSLLLHENSPDHRSISIWPSGGGFRLWEKHELLWEFESQSPDGDQLKFELSNWTHKGIFLIPTGGQPAFCLPARTEGTLKFPVGDSEFAMEISKTLEGHPALKLKSRLGSFAIVNSRTIR